MDAVRLQVQYKDKELKISEWKRREMGRNMIQGNRYMRQLKKGPEKVEPIPLPKRVIGLNYAKNL